MKVVPRKEAKRGFGQHIVPKIDGGIEKATWQFDEDIYSMLLAYTTWKMTAKAEFRPTKILCSILIESSVGLVASIVVRKYFQKAYRDH